MITIVIVILARHLQKYFFVAVTYLFILQRGIIVSHNSVDGLLNTFCLRRARLVAKDAEVEMTCSSEFIVEVE